MRAEPRQDLGSATEPEAPTPLTDYTFTIREALYQLPPDGRRNHKLLAPALADLDRLAAANQALNHENANLNSENRNLLEKWSERGAALERAERKLAMCIDVQDTNQRTYWQMTEHYQTTLTKAEVRAEQAERALAEIIEEFRSGSGGYDEDDPVVIIARTALRPSEEDSEITGDGSGEALPPIIEDFSPPRTWNPSGGAGASPASSSDAAGAEQSEDTSDES